MMPTIKDVARQAGVAVSTVSLVVNRKGRVSKDTEKKVLRAIKQLDYHPRRTARRLATRTTGNIGFILTHDHFSNAEPFYTKIFLGTEFEARQLDYYVLLTTVDREIRGEESIPRFLLERNVDGVIFAGTMPRKIVEYTQKAKIPITFVDYLLNGVTTSEVIIDNFNGIRQATQHLIERGHKHLAFIGGDMEHPSLRERCEGFQRTLIEAGLPIEKDLIICNQSLTGPQDGFEATYQLLETHKKFTAIVAANDAMAVGALRACRDRKLRIPEDVAITGFDNVEAALTARPTLTTVHVPKEEMGAMAIRHLSNLIKGVSGEGTRIIIPVKLVCRESTQHDRKNR
jgi:LacI family transcriptional regulator